MEAGQGGGMRECGLTIVARVRVAVRMRMEQSEVEI